MLAFLAIVADEDLRKGKTDPSYILCKSDGTNETRTGYVVVHADIDDHSIPKLLFRDMEMDNPFIHFMSRFRVRQHGKDDRKFTPTGALFWFPCDLNGDREISQPPIFIKRVPDKRYPREGTKQILETERKEQYSFLNLLVHNPNETEMLPITKREYVQ